MTILAAARHPENFKYAVHLADAKSHRSVISSSVVASEPASQ
jgi:hypothetical protein